MRRVSSHDGLGMRNKVGTERALEQSHATFSQVLLLQFDPKNMVTSNILLDAGGQKLEAGGWRLEALLVR